MNPLDIVNNEGIQDIFMNAEYLRVMLFTLFAILIFLFALIFYLIRSQVKTWDKANKAQSLQNDELRKFAEVISKMSKKIQELVDSVDEAKGRVVEQSANVDEMRREVLRMQTYCSARNGINSIENPILKNQGGENV